MVGKKGRGRWGTRWVRECEERYGAEEGVERDGKEEGEKRDGEEV